MVLERGAQEGCARVMPYRSTLEWRWTVVLERGYWSVGHGCGAGARGSAAVLESGAGVWCSSGVRARGAKAWGSSVVLWSGAMEWCVSVGIERDDRARYAIMVLKRGVGPWCSSVALKRGVGSWCWSAALERGRWIVVLDRGVGRAVLECGAGPWSSRVLECGARVGARAWCRSVVLEHGARP